MAELDNLLGSRISLISQQDVRYEGILFSINQTESSIVLQNGTPPPPLSILPYPSLTLLLSFVSLMFWN